MENFSNITQIDNGSEMFSYTQIIYTLVSCIILLSSAFFSTIFNFLLILSWIIKKDKENFADLILISMAICDFINGIFVCPSIFLIYNEDISGIKIGVNKLIFEFISYSVDATVNEISVLSLLILSLHRYRQLNDPFKEKARLNRFRICLIISIWFISFSFWFIGNRLFFFNEDFVINVDNNEFVYLGRMFIFYFVPIIFIIILNILIIKSFKLKMKNKKLIKTNLKKEKKAIACTNSITLLLLLTFGVGLVLQPLEYYTFINDIYGVKYLTYYYSALNPLVVFLFNKKFRNILKK